MIRFPFLLSVHLEAAPPCCGIYSTHIHDCFFEVKHNLSQPFIESMEILDQGHKH